MGGTHELDLPTAFDGTDLEVHLVHNLVPRMIDTAPPNETAQPVSIAPEDDSALPASSGGVTLLALALASCRGAPAPGSCSGGMSMPKVQTLQPDAERP